MIVGLGRPPMGMRGMGDLDPDAILAPSRDELGVQTDTLLARIDQLSKDWFNSDGNFVTQEQLARWDAFVREVNSWDAGPRFLVHLTALGWRDDLLNYQRKFNDFAVEWRNAGVAVTTPMFTFNPAPPGTFDKIVTAAENAASKIPNPLKPIGTAITTFEIIGGVIGLAAVGYIFYLTFETGRTARSIAPRVLR